ncbi:oleosin H1-like [Nymphaea colorata]|uniref:oleosin H1-like n=1 Tax=Nymphaea colorata TaxID=210225 RepID=UPI00129E3403|nr:oleosin H1-like [Nymphaea colorata]
MPLRRINFQTPGSSMLLATMASVAIVFPLLGMMGFSLFASLTILLLASPLSLLFSPVLLPAAIVLAGAVVAFSFAALLAVAGLSAFAWIYRSFKKRLSSARSPSSEKPQIKVHDFGKGPSMVTESGEVKGPSATFVNGELQTGKVKLGSF